MKVIKSGITKKWSRVCICDGNGNSEDGCGAELEVELPDLFRTGSEPMATFICPECHTLTDVDSRWFPSCFAADLPTREDFFRRE